MTYMKTLSSSTETSRLRHCNSGAMRTVLVATVALVIAGLMTASSVEAQTWTQRTSNTTQNLTAVVFSTATTAAAVGGNTAITVSSDGGSTWASTNLGDGATLNAVFSDGTTIVTVGDDGGTPDMIAASGDRGATWGFVTGPANNQDLSAGIFVSATNVIVLDGQNGGASDEIMLSVDRGASFVVVFNTPQEMFAVDSRGSLVIAVGDNQVPNETVARSANLGVAWANASSVPGTLDAYNDVVIVSATNAVAVGANGHVGLSTDAGDRWHQPYTAAATLNAVDASSGFVVAVGAGGAIAISNNSGANGSWSSPVSPTIQDLNDVLFLSGNFVLAVGNAGTIIGSTDRGATWTAQSSGVTVNLQKIAYNGLNNTLVVGDPDGTPQGVILLSLDQISVTAPIPFQSKWLLVGLLLAAGLLALRRYGPAR